MNEPLVWNGMLCYHCGAKIMARDISERWPHLLARVLDESVPCPCQSWKRRIAP